MTSDFMVSQASVVLASFLALFLLLPAPSSSLPLSALSPPRSGLFLRMRMLVATIKRHPYVAGLAHHMHLRKQRLNCLRELPNLLDVVILGLSAGLSFDASLELYCTHYEGELSSVFQETMMLWRLGVYSKKEALVLLSDRLGVSALTRFVSSVVQALECGSPLVLILANQA